MCRAGAERVPAGRVAGAAVRVRQRAEPPPTCRRRGACSFRSTWPRSSCWRVPARSTRWSGAVAARRVAGVGGGCPEHGGQAARQGCRCPFTSAGWRCAARTATRPCCRRRPCHLPWLERTARAGGVAVRWGPADGPGGHGRLRFRASRTAGRHGGHRTGHPTASAPAAAAGSAARPRAARLARHAGASGWHRDTVIETILCGNAAAAAPGSITSPAAGPAGRNPRKATVTWPASWEDLHRRRPDPDPRRRPLPAPGPPPRQGQSPGRPRQHPAQSPAQAALHPRRPLPGPRPGLLRPPDRAAPPDRPPRRQARRPRLRSHPLPHPRTRTRRNWEQPGRLTIPPRRPGGTITARVRCRLPS
jgi:hypothetical protein